MSEIVDLTRFIPEDQKGTKIELVEDLLPVVSRIGQVLPLIKFGHSSQVLLVKQGRVVCFPYCRVDAAVLSCRQGLLLIDSGAKPKSEKFVKWYELASRLALTALLWVEIGFQGLENLAKSPASKNWTSGVKYAGRYATDEERTTGVMTEGARLYRDCLGKFVAFRNQQGITEDYFTQYRVEYLLDGFRAIGKGNV